MNSAAQQYYVPGNFVAKLVYLILSLLVFGFGAWFALEISHAMVFGERTEARVVAIRELVPGEEEHVYRYRRPYDPHPDYRTIYQHDLEIFHEGSSQIYRLSVDARRNPADGCNVNDRIPVAYLPKSEARIAFAYTHARTWGAAALFGSIGLAMLATAIPMLWAVGKPIPIDPEPPARKPDANEAEPA